MIVDFHTHIVSPAIKERRSEYLGRDRLFDGLYANPKAKLATAEDVVVSMDRAGVDVSVVLNIGWTTHELCVRTNDYIIEAVARHPDRLVGFCAVQPRAGKAAVTELQRCAKSGLKGVGELRPDTQRFDLGDKEVMQPVIEAMMEHRLVFLTHASEPVGHSYPGKGIITPDILYRFISNFPQLTIVLAHWGGGLPFYALMPEVAEALSNVYFDTAASLFLYRDEIFKHIVEIVGPDKILFGTDYPLIRQGRLLKSVRSLNLPEDVKNMILGGNAKRILNLVG